MIKCHGSLCHQGVSSSDIDSVVWADLCFHMCMHFMALPTTICMTNQIERTKHTWQHILPYTCFVWTSGYISFWIKVILGPLSCGLYTDTKYVWCADVCCIGVTCRSELSPATCQMATAAIPLIQTLPLISISFIHVTIVIYNMTQCSVGCGILCTFSQLYQLKGYISQGCDLYIIRQMLTI